MEFMPKTSIDLSRFDTPAKRNMLFNALIEKTGSCSFVAFDSDRYTRYIDYHGGKAMKIDISGDSFEPRLFDRDNGGSGTALSIVNKQLELINKV